MISTSKNRRPKIHSLHFTPEWKTTVVFLCLLLLLLSLGQWQLRRAEEKVQLAQSYEQRLKRSSITVDELIQAGSDIAHIRVNLKGQFDNEKTYLLENRMNKGKIGFDVFSVFIVDDLDRQLLINRGWIAGSYDRSYIPPVAEINGIVGINVRVYVPPGEPFTLGPLLLNTNWPKRIQYLDIKQIETDLQTTLFPFSLRIEARQKGALTTDWQIINVQPEKHTAYAVQWFAMALLLVIFYIAYSSNLFDWIKSK